MAIAIIIVLILIIIYFYYKLGILHNALKSINEALYKKEWDQAEYLSNLERIKNEINKINTSSVVDSSHASELLSGKIIRNKNTEAKPSSAKDN